MQKRSKPKRRDFDQAFDEGSVEIDFSTGTITEGLSSTVKLPPTDIPAWLSMEIDRLAKFQANSRASVIRQLLVEAVEARHRRLAG